MSFDPTKLKVVKQISRKDILFRLARAPQTSRIFVGSSDSNVYDLDILAEKPEPQSMPGHVSYVMGVVVAGEHVVTGAYDGQLIWWNAENREKVRTIDAHQRWIRNLIVSPDETQVISVSDDMACRVWDAQSGDLVKELKGHDSRTPHHFPSMLYACAMSDDGKLVATGDKTGRIVVWELETGKPLTTLEAPLMYTWDPKQRIHSIGGVRALAFSPDGKTLAAGGIGQIGNIDHLGAKARIETFDWQSGKRLLEYESDKHKGIVEKFLFDRDGKWLLAVGGDHKGFIEFLDLAAGKPIKQDKAPMHVHDIVFNENRDALFAAGHGKLVVWGQ